MLEQWYRFVIVDALKQNRIHLDRSESNFLRSFNAFNDIGKAIAVSHLLEPFRRKCVQGNIHPLQARIF